MERMIVESTTLEELAGLESQPEDERAWRFVDSAEVQDWQRQLNYGLIHPTEYAHKILAAWETFK